VTYLLDVNVLLALLDADHVFHDQAHCWFEAEVTDGWATCPITENGVIRILGQPRYPKGPGTPAAAAQLLRTALSMPRHVFWPDDISVVSSPNVHCAALGTSAQVTDTYLLALAIHHGGILATFDRRLSPAAVPGGAKALQVIA
jgi:toxin-antitoxin system PIN domain toxin